uniref:glycosyltransferase family A protein n=1 Tax=Tabrizicola sp. TaxID=2005166 RepID=UPI00286CDD0E
MLEHQLFRTPSPGEPLVLAVFSYRYDAHLVPDLLENIKPSVHGFVAWDDRAAGSALSDEPARRNALLAEARRLGADWILAVDPDERFEDRLAVRMPEMLAQGRDSLWVFSLLEVFDEHHVRTDGLWGAKRLMRLFPLAAAVGGLTIGLHGSWVADDGGFQRRLAKINLYHLRMASPVRRKMRRALYAMADPERRFQAMGYDYLDDERGMVLERVDPARGFSPPFKEDHGLWAPDPGQIGQALPDPFEVKLTRVAALTRQLGQAQAHHLVNDLRKDSPEDGDLPFVSARLALMARAWADALGAADEALKAEPDDLHARLIRISALVGQSRRSEAAGDLATLQGMVPDGPVISALTHAVERPHADFAAPDAQWRRWVNGPADCVSGHRVATADLAVVVIGFRAQSGLLAAVRSVLEQDEAAEIVVVNTGGGAPERVLAPVLNQVRLISVEVPMYVGAARNIGVDVSRAPWIAFLAGDCMARPGWVSGRLQWHRAGAQSVATAVIEAEGSSLAGVSANRLRYSTRHPSTPVQDVSLYGQSYARHLLALVGAFRTGVKVAEDTALNHVAARFAAPVWAPEVQTCHRETASLAHLVLDERVRGGRSADHPPFRQMVAADDHVTAISGPMGARLRASSALIDTEAGLTPAERTSIKATQWVASAAACAGLREAMVRLKASDDALFQAEAMAASHPEAALSAANEAWRLDPQGWQKAQMLGTLRQAQGDLAGAESAYRAAASLA